MPSLIEKSPCDGLLPVSAGGASLTELHPGPITSVAPLSGEAGTVDQRLRTMGLAWPAPNRAVTREGAAILWTGRDQAFLLGVAPAGLAGVAALTDQSDGWAVMELRGPACGAVLARLVATDLRDAAFAPGHVARTGLSHMMSVLWRTEREAVTIMVFRSMAATAVHELHAAMKAVAARAHV